MWVYPQKQDSVIEGREHLSSSVFNTGVLCKPFCKYCGVHVCNDHNTLTGTLLLLGHHKLSFCSTSDISFVCKRWRR